MSAFPPSRSEPLPRPSSDAAQALASGRMVAGFVPASEVPAFSLVPEPRLRRRSLRERCAFGAFFARGQYSGRQWRKLRKRLGLSLKVRA